MVNGRTLLLLEERVGPKLALARTVVLELDASVLLNVERQ